jgi:hypothetical protein
MNIVNSINSITNAVKDVPYAFVGLFCRSDVVSVDGGNVTDAYLRSDVVLHATDGKDITIDVACGGEVVTITPKVNVGTAPVAKVFTFQKNGNSDIFYSVTREDDSVYCAVFSVVGGSAVTVFDSEDYITSDSFFAISGARVSATTDAPSKSTAKSKKANAAEKGISASLAACFPYFNGATGVFNLQMWVKYSDSEKLFLVNLKKAKDGFVSAFSAVVE